MFKCLGSFVLKAFLALNLVKIPEKMKNTNLTIKTYFQNQRLQGIERNWKQSSVANPVRVGGGYQLLTHPPIFFRFYYNPLLKKLFAQPFPLHQPDKKNWPV